MEHVCESSNQTDDTTNSINWDNLGKGVWGSSHKTARSDGLAISNEANDRLSFQILFSVHRNVD